MEKQVLSPHEFIVRAVNAHPSLYAAPTYDEDMAKFMTLRWAQELQKILSFLDETIEYLFTLLDSYRDASAVHYRYLKPDNPSI